MASANAKRVDPAPRYLGAPPIFTLENADPGRKYVWVDQATPAEGHGREYYEIVGYRVETIQEGGVKPRGMKLKKGDEIVVRGMWLMSVDRAEWTAAVREGQRQADVREQQIVKRRGMFDPTRGIGNMNNRQGDPYVMFEEKVEPLKHVIGGD